MGISSHIFRAFLREHKHRALQGQGLLVGRQSIFFSQDEMKRMAAAEGVAVRDIEAQQDVETRGGGELTDYQLFESFSELDMKALDVTDYEGAPIVHDMHYPVPQELHGQFDFIYNGSCMDNLFNPAEFLRNVSRMLKPGGRFVSIEHGSPYPGAYMTYSPDYFFDFFAANNYADAMVFVCDFLGWHSPHHMQSPWSIYNWNPLRYGEAKEHSMHLSFSHRLILAVAEKGPDSTNEVMPIQGQYSADDAPIDSVHRQASERFLKSSRLDAYRLPSPVDWNNSPAVSNLEFVGVL
jgi:SAM-dependent methyltransferase